MHTITASIAYNNIQRTYEQKFVPAENLANAEWVSLDFVFAKSVCIVILSSAKRIYTILFGSFI